MTQDVVCNYCGDLAELVTGDVIYKGRSDLASLKFWRCVPCKAMVGCHAGGNGYGDGTRPLGILANQELRDARKTVHGVFDPIWQCGYMSRSAAYKWLSEQLGKTKEETHIAMFDLEDCARARQACIRFLKKTDLAIRGN